MKNLRTLFLLTAFLPMLAMAASPMQHYALDVKDFAELKVVDGINVTYHSSADSAGYVVFDCPADVAPAIILINNKNTLKIELQDDALLIAKSLPTVHVYSSFLAKAENSGDSTLMVQSPAPSAQIKFTLIGNGRLVAHGLHATVVEGKNAAGHGQMVLSGVAQWVKLRTTGAGSIEAGALKADKASLTMTGTGNIDCWCTGELSVKGLGTGKVYCKGRPADVKNRTLGSIKIVNVE